MLKLRELPVVEQPGYRLMHRGPQALSASELLDIVAGTGLRIGDEILAALGGLEGLKRASEQDLAQLPRIGPGIAVRIKASMELSRRLLAASPDSRGRITAPSDAFAALSDMQFLEQEELHILVLDTKNQVITRQALYRGNVNTSVIRTVEVFREAVKRNATAILVAHNHPSGDPAPSPEDVRTTRSIVQAGNVLDIDVLDHLIIGAGRYISLKERGLGFS
jgi:DNA repair protein RadC